MHLKKSVHALALLGVLAMALNAADSVAPEEKPSEGFKSLFNGKDLEGWKTHNAKKNMWSAEKGVLFVKGGGGGWLMTEKEYGDFELRLQYKLTKAANSGVALRAPLMGDPAYQGMEIQIIDDEGYPAKLQTWQHTGSIYDVVPAKKQNNKPIGEWNSYRIVCKGDKVTVELNGEVLVDADLSKHKDKAKRHPGILRSKGHIGFQEHGGRVEFRNIWIKEM